MTGATGLVGSHVARPLVERGDSVRVTTRPRSRLGNLAELDVERVECDVLDRRAVRRAMRGVERVFHVAGLTNLRADADTLFRINVQGTTTVLEEALRAGVERCVHTSSVAAVGPAPRGSTADERQVFRAGRYGLPYINAKHEAEKEALRIGGLGLPVVVVNPGARLRRRRRLPLVDRAGAPLPAPRDPGLRRRRAEHRRRRGRRARAICSPTSAARRASATSSATATSRSTGSSPTSGRLSGVEPPAVKLPLAAAIALARGARAQPAAGAPADHGRRGARGVAVVGVSLDEGQARARLQARAPRGHAAGDDRLVPRARARRGCASPGRASRSRCAWRASASSRPTSVARAGWTDGDTLYRCRTPTDWLCPCGRVARELRQGRARTSTPSACPWRRRDRPEVQALSGQRSVPLLVLDGEAICDSKRIVEHLRWRRTATAARSSRRREQRVGDQALGALDVAAERGVEREQHRAPGAGRLVEHGRGAAQRRRCRARSRRRRTRCPSGSARRRCRRTRAGPGRRSSNAKPLGALAPGDRVVRVQLHARARRRASRRRPAPRRSPRDPGGLRQRDALAAHADERAAAAHPGRQRREPGRRRGRRRAPSGTTNARVAADAQPRRGPRCRSASTLQAVALLEQPVRPGERRRRDALVEHRHARRAQRDGAGRPGDRRSSPVARRPARSARRPARAARIATSAAPSSRRRTAGRAGAAGSAARPEHAACGSRERIAPPSRPISSGLDHDATS